MKLKFKKIIIFIVGLLAFYVAHAGQKESGDAYNSSFALSELIAAAKDGNVDAQSRLGSMYYFGDGVPKNYTIAANWFLKSAEQGNAWAQNFMGLMYKNGEGVPKDNAQAVKWFRKSADQGNAFSQNDLALMFRSGLGVPKDNTQALYWLRKAADNGEPNAQQTLGFVYESGQEGLSKDISQAIYWYLKAAEQGNSTGQYHLARAYANGISVQKNLVVAYALFSLAATDVAKKNIKGEAEKVRNQVSMLITPKQLEVGQCLAIELGKSKNLSATIAAYLKESVC